MFINNECIWKYGSMEELKATLAVYPHFDIGRSAHACVGCNNTSTVHTCVGSHMLYNVHRLKWTKREDYERLKGQGCMSLDYDVRHWTIIKPLIQIYRKYETNDA